MSAAVGVYVHWPYCARICPYCDFNVVRERGQREEQAALGAAIVADLRAHAGILGKRDLASIYFGGGTPSLMDAALTERVIATCAALWTPADDLEITLEANPTDAEAGRFEAFAAAGVNRLSLGLQSLDDTSLKFLGRNHDAAAGRRAAAAAAAVFDRFSLDLIYALPDQSPAAWRSELAEAVAFGAEHVSAYQLTIEPGVAFERLARRGRLVLPEPEIAADFFATTDEVLSAVGLSAYEISNHACGRGARSRHNLIYWRGGEYIGVGPGAHGRLTLADGRNATFAPRAVAAYVAKVAEMGAGSEREPLSAGEVAQERLVMGLRTTEGVALRELAALGIDADAAQTLIELGLIDLDNERLTIVSRGRPLTDAIVLELARAGSANSAAA